jgi:putative transposase
LVFADELDIHLRSKVGAAWMPKGSQEEVMTPGQNEKHYLAGALDLSTGKIFHGRGTRKTHAVLRDLLTLLARPYAPQQVRRIYVVVDNDRLHKAKAVGQWLATQPRFELLWLPTSCPRANPLARLSGHRLLTQQEDGAKPLTLLDLGLFCPAKNGIHNLSKALFLIFKGLTLFSTPCLSNLWQAFRKSKRVDTLTTASWSRAASMVNRGLSRCSISAQPPNSSTGS